MKELIEFMARAIVENPDAVDVTEEDAGDHFIFYLKVADEDMGRVIGKQGRIANAMRTMLKVAAIRRGVRAVLEIGEPRGDRGGRGRGPAYEDRDDYDSGETQDDDTGYGEGDTAHEEDAAYEEPQMEGGSDQDDSQNNGGVATYSEDERDDR